VNVLKGSIRSITSSGVISLVEVEVQGECFSAVVLEEGPKLAVGMEVLLLFKETEVALGKQFIGKISLRNQFKGAIVAIDRGAILTVVTIDYKGTSINSVITTNAARDLELNVGEVITGFIKTNELMISTE
jgi:molybdate transport system regulatory protein